MHIVFLSSVHPPLDKRVFDKEAVSLAKAGYRVTHLTPGEGENFHERGVDVFLYPPSPGIRGRLRQLGRLYRLAAKLDADCYHCNEVDSWFIGVLLKILRRKKCVFDVHEHYPSTFAESRFPRPLRPLASNLVRLFYQLMLPFTDKLVLAKKSVAGDFWLSDSKQVVVRNFAPSRTLASRDPDATAPDAPLRLIHLGLISRLRGWPQILEAMARARNADMELLVIGDFNDGSLADFYARARELGLEKRVDVLDWMPFEEAFGHLLKADVGLVTFMPGTQNHVFAMPHKMFDYMLAELAVILPDFAVEVAPVISENDCGLLLDPSDVQALAGALDQLADDRVACRNMGRRGKAAVMAKYNWEREAQRLVNMYREMDE